MSHTRLPAGIIPATTHLLLQYKTPKQVMLIVVKASMVGAAWPPASRCQPDTNCQPAQSLCRSAAVTPSPNPPLTRPPAQAKAILPPLEIFYLGFLSGCYVALGASLAMTAASAVNSMSVTTGAVKVS